MAFVYFFFGTEYGMAITPIKITCCHPLKMLGSKNDHKVLSVENVASEANISLFAAPNNSKAMVPDAVIVMIPLRSLGILSILFNIPVMKPHTAPMSIPKIVATIAGVLCLNNKAHEAPPINMLPSAVISAKSSILKVKKTPNANNMQGNPSLSMSRKNSMINNYSAFFQGNSAGKSLTANPASVKFCSLYK